MYINFNGNNQTYITLNSKHKDLLCSYNTIIAFYDKKKDIIIRTDRFYSVTSSKHFNQWVKFNGFEGKNIKTIKDDSFRKIIYKI